MRDSWILICVIAAVLTACGDGNGGDEAESVRRSPYQEPGESGEIRGLDNFATLIKLHIQGKTAKTPWAGPWWPFADDGIASAASRHDAVHGSDAASWEQNNHGRRVGGESWWGHCNGWAAAAALFPEPRHTVTEGGQTFSVSDQKALLSEAAMEVDAEFFGLRAEGSSGAAFEDNHPNQFFLVLTNYVGNGLPLLIDRYTGYQVWNQPLAGYRIEEIRPEDYLGTDPDAPNVHRVNVTTQIWWTRNDVSGSHQTEPFDFRDTDSYESRTLRYEVWLDGAPRFEDGKLVSSGRVITTRRGPVVIGGQWKNGNLESANSHPDYMWVVRGVSPSSGYTNPRIKLNWVISKFGR